MFLADHVPIAAGEVRVVDRAGDETRVGPLDEEQRDAVMNGLLTLGEVMRSEGLKASQLDLPLEGK